MPIHFDLGLRICRHLNIFCLFFSFSSPHFHFPFLGGPRLSRIQKIQGLSPKAPDRISTGFQIIVYIRQFCGDDQRTAVGD